MSRGLLLSVVVLIAPLSFPVRAADALEGKRVVVIHKAPLVSGTTSETAGVGSVFTVDKVDGDGLWIKSEKAFLRRADVVPFGDAIAYYTQLLETNKTSNNYWHRAQIWRLKGELELALADMNDAIRLNPAESSWFLRRGILWDDKKNYDKAIADYSEAIRLNPKNSEAYDNRGVAWSAKKEYDRAIADYDEALKHTDPNVKTGMLNDSEITGGDSTAMVNSQALMFNNRGAAWQNKGKYDKALADYDEAIRLEPKFFTPFDNVAWLRATCPDKKYRNGQQAVEYATKACKLTAWKNAGYLDTLAVAYAESGDFEKAIDLQQMGMDLAPAVQKADFETRLKLYREKRTYRELPAK